MRRGGAVLAADAEAVILSGAATRMTFDEWLAELDAIAKADGVSFTTGQTFTQITGTDCWLDAFEDAMTPQEAWDEEKVAGI